MRLTNYQQETILQLFALYFSAGDSLWLFGSRVDAAKKGGDIDLYIETDNDDLMAINQKKIIFARELKKRLGDQKIDIIVNQLNANNKLKIYDEARSTGILLVKGSSPVN